MVELNADLTGTVPGTERVIIQANSGAGEGSHFYKIDGKYFITLTNYDPLCYQASRPCRQTGGTLRNRCDQCRKPLFCRRCRNQAGSQGWGLLFVENRRGMTRVRQ